MTPFFKTFLFVLLFQNGADASFRLSSGMSYYSPISVKYDSALPSDVANLITSTLNGYLSVNVPGIQFTINQEGITTPNLLFTYDTSSAFCEDAQTAIGQTMGMTTTIKIVHSSQINCATQGWILHLVMHAFGFLHEHQRSDASTKMFINYGEMDPQFSYDTSFKNAHLEMRYDGNTDGTMYDYMSVMHYHYRALGKNSSSLTFLSIPPDFISRKSYGHATDTGRRNTGLSFGDIAALQNMFPWFITPVLEQVACNNGGTFYGFCACPPGYSGPLCEDEEIDCYHACQHGGHCQINEMTNQPKCFNCVNWAGSYCEQSLQSYNKGECLGCPWWATCSSDGRCLCDPYPYSGTYCEQSAPITPLPPMSMTAATFPTPPTYPTPPTPGTVAPPSSDVSTNSDSTTTTTTTTPSTSTSSTASISISSTTVASVTNKAITIRANRVVINAAPSTKNREATIFVIILLIESFFALV